MLSPEMLTATAFRPVGAGPAKCAPVFGSNFEPWHGQLKLEGTVQPWCGQIALKATTVSAAVRVIKMSAPLSLAAIEEPMPTDESAAMTGPLPEVGVVAEPVAELVAELVVELDAESDPELDAELDPELASDVEPVTALPPASFGLGALLHAASAAADRPAAPTASTDRRLTPEVAAVPWGAES